MKYSLLQLIPRYDKICEDLLNKLFVKNTSFIYGGIRVEEGHMYIYAKQVFLI